MFYRLTTVADDFGRFPADPRILLAECFPLRVDRIKSSAVQKWYGEMERSGLVVTYEAGGRLLGYFPTWIKYQGAPRATASRYPTPPEPENAVVENKGDSGCVQVRADVPVLRSSVLRSTVKEHDNDLHAPNGCAPTPDLFEAFWQDYPKPRRKVKHAAKSAWTALRLNAETVKRIMTSLAAWKRTHDWLKENGRFIPWPQKFLSKRYWEEVPETGTPGDQESEAERDFLATLHRGGDS